MQEQAQGVEERLRLRRRNQKRRALLLLVSGVYRWVEYVAGGFWTNIFPGRVQRVVWPIFPIGDALSGVSFGETWAAN